MLVVEQTMQPTTWLVVTGWSATPPERRIMEAKMTADPWTHPDPAPGDFDADLASLAPELVTIHDGDPAATLRILVSVEGEDASRLQRIAEEQGKKPRGCNG